LAAALWQHFVAAASDSCKLTLAERIISGLGLDGSLPEIFQPRASCADAAVDLLGLPYEFWSLGLFVLLGLMTLVMLGARRR
jgi:disulfide bond formation protein DsbB